LLGLHGQRRRTVPARINYSYTANWPPEPLAGNFVTGDAVIWSVISIVGLLGGTGLVFYFFGRYDWLGWSDNESKPIRFRPVHEVAVTQLKEL
jgi:nitric oxide reductase subunit B